MKMILAFVFLNVLYGQDVIQWTVPDTPKPIVSKYFGEWHVLKIKLVKQVGLKIVRNTYSILEIDGVKIEGKKNIIVKFLSDSNQTMADGELVVAGFEAIEHHGIPGDPPNGFDVNLTPADFAQYSVLNAFVKN